MSIKNGRNETEKEKIRDELADILNEGISLIYGDDILAKNPAYFNGVSRVIGRNKLDNDRAYEEGGEIYFIYGLQDRVKYKEPIEKYEPILKWKLIDSVNDCSKLIQNYGDIEYTLSSENEKGKAEKAIIKKIETMISSEVKLSNDDILLIIENFQNIPINLAAEIINSVPEKNLEEFLGKIDCTADIFGCSLNEAMRKVNRGEAKFIANDKICEEVLSRDIEMTTGEKFRDELNKKQRIAELALKYRNDKHIDISKDLAPYIVAYHLLYENERANGLLENIDKSDYLIIINEMNNIIFNIIDKSKYDEFTHHLNGVILNAYSREDVEKSEIKKKVYGVFDIMLKNHPSIELAKQISAFDYNLFGECKYFTPEKADLVLKSLKNESLTMSNCYALLYWIIGSGLGLSDDQLTQIQVFLDQVKDHQNEDTQENLEGYSLDLLKIITKKANKKILEWVKEFFPKALEVSDPSKEGEIQDIAL